LRFKGEKALERLLDDPLQAIQDSEIICLLCGQPFQSLYAHLHTHQVSPDEYKRLIGYKDGVFLIARGKTPEFVKTARAQVISENVDGYWDATLSEDVNCQNIAGVFGITEKQIWKLYTGDSQLKKMRETPYRAIGKQSITCLECGKKFRSLTTDHLRTHGLDTWAEYKTKWAYAQHTQLNSHSAFIDYIIGRDRKIVTKRWNARGWQGRPCTVDDVISLWDVSKTREENLDAIGEQFDLCWGEIIHLFMGKKHPKKLQLMELMDKSSQHSQQEQCSAKKSTANLLSVDEYEELSKLLALGTDPDIAALKLGIQPNTVKEYTKRQKKAQRNSEKISRLKADPMAAINNTTITCLVCGQEFKVLTANHLATHGHTGKSYKKTFGYAPDVALMSREQLKKQENRDQRLNWANPACRPDVTKDQILTLREQGCKVDAISAELGISRSLIYRRLKEV